MGLRQIRKWLSTPLPAVLVALLLFPCASMASKAYVIDSSDAPIRSGPKSINRVIATLQPGTAVELLRANDYTRIRFTTEAGETKEGWILARSLGPQPPEEMLTRELETENSQLKATVAAADKEKADLSQREKALTEKLTKLEAEYESLKSGSANYVKLKEDYDSVKATLSTAQENIQTLIQENQSMKISQNMKWFGAGAAVLILGWFFGWLTGRRRQKRKSTYFF